MCGHAMRSINKTNTRKKLILANDKLFREIIQIRDKVCQKTGRTTNPQVCHFYTRSNLRVRWIEDNACLLNGGTHLFWAHKNPTQFREFWIKRLGQKKFDELEILARYIAPVKELDLLLRNYDLKRRLKSLREV